LELRSFQPNNRGGNSGITTNIRDENATHCLIKKMQRGANIGRLCIDAAASLRIDPGGSLFREKDPAAAQSGFVQRAFSIPY
jgi:hypothetical protein